MPNQNASDENVTAIASLIEAYHDRFSAGDIEGVLDLWAEQGSVMEPGAQTATGKEQLRAAYERGYAGAGYHFVCKIDGIVVGDNLGSVVSTADGTVTVKATGDMMSISARQIFAVQRVGGEWKLLHYMFQEAPSA